MTARATHAKNARLDAVVLAVGVVLFPVAAMAAPAQPTVVRESVTSDELEAHGTSCCPAVSADGRFVAFTSDAPDLVPKDTNGVRDVFVRDRAGGVTQRVSVSSTGQQERAAASPGGAVNADGRFVAFSSLAGNLVPGDTNHVVDVFVRDRMSGSTERVSLSSSGGQATRRSSLGGLSGDGRYVVFSSPDPALVPGDTNGQIDVFVRDRVAGTTSRVNVSTAQEQANDWPGFDGGTAISADGRFVAFASAASNLVSSDTNSEDDIFLRDLQTGRTSRVDVSSSEQQAQSGSSGEPSISADGRFVAFSSTAAGLVPVAPGPVGTGHIYVRDRLTGHTSRASVNSGGKPGNRTSQTASISADGRFVAFQSFATNLALGAGPELEVFVRDRSAGTTTHVSVNSFGCGSNDSNVSASISGDGRFISFSSLRPDLVPDDTNGTQDVFGTVWAAPVSC